MKTGIFTTRPLNPMHPRIEALIKFLDSRGIVFEIIPPEVSSLFGRINWLSLFFFDNYSVFKKRHKLKEYDIIFIQDLKFLPLARYAAKLNKKVIYETLDNNVSLRHYLLEKRFPFLRSFHALINRKFVNKEKKLALRYCKSVIVNSKALVDYFEKSAELVYYCSSFENLNLENNPLLPPAILYLGDFSSEKGAGEIIALKKGLGLPMYIYGTIPSPSIRAEISDIGDIRFNERLSHDKLAIELRKLMSDHYLAGVSFIKSIHYSYATQEANKEIDYLALGIPFIGNHRGPTAEKISAGCGVFEDDEAGLARLLNDNEYKRMMTLECKRYYSANYSWSRYVEGMTTVFGKIENQ